MKLSAAQEAIYLEIKESFVGKEFTRYSLRKTADYRSMHKLEDAGLIRRVRFEEGISSVRRSVNFGRTTTYHSKPYGTAVYLLVD